MTEDEMVGRHHWFNGREFKQAPGDDKGQGSLLCCTYPGHKESDMTERLNKILNNNKKLCYKCKTLYIDVRGIKVMKVYLTTGYTICTNHFSQRNTKYFYVLVYLCISSFINLLIHPCIYSFSNYLRSLGGTKMKQTQKFIVSDEKDKCICIHYQAHVPECSSFLKTNAVKLAHLYKTNHINHL